MPEESRAGPGVADGEALGAEVPLAPAPVVAVLLVEVLVVPDLVAEARVVPVPAPRPPAALPLGLLAGFAGLGDPPEPVGRDWRPGAPEEDELTRGADPLRLRGVGRLLESLAMGRSRPEAEELDLAGEVDAVPV